MFTTIYTTFALLASAGFLWLSWTGPPPPLARQADLPAQALSPTFLMGNVSYRRFDDPAADALWDALVPSNGGAVLATNLSSGFHVWAVPAMFHQLRCLRAIRAQFVALRDDAARQADGLPQVGEARRFLEDKTRGSAYDEIAYCFDYVRQLTPEQRLIDGNALWHMCKDSSVLYQWADVSGIPRTDPLVRQHPITPKPKLGQAQN